MRCTIIYYAYPLRVPFRRATTRRFISCAAEIDSDQKRPDANPLRSTGTVFKPSSMHRDARGGRDARACHISHQSMTIAADSKIEGHALVDAGRGCTENVFPSTKDVDPTNDNRDGSIS